MHSVLVNRINRTPLGKVFSAADFLNLAQRNTIDQTLSRLSRKNHILKVATGLYCKPLKNPIVGNISPNIDDIVRSYAHKFGYKVQVSPAKAANLLGLSLQVPAQHIYLTDGPNRSLTLGSVPVTFKHVCPRKLLGLDIKAGLVIQALYYYGNKGITDAVASKIKAILDNRDKKQLKSWLGLLPVWMQSILVRDVLND
ncbi:DUF6088 family protein [Candidatus Nucleicultrix amoebiphila]|jgi:hypothetical protein|uniref:DUF6088 family protein n=1 Tax=Candidatus Nucleicultrix amoebiphila TaxID=1509244 RepID=UPI000A26FA20|nr:DUF6088 family protein [Candidatus Nucleicultrix amoebiphila]